MEHATREAREINVGYREGIDILQGLSLRVAPGAITSIIGPNGAGKSTLLRCLFGLLPARKGDVLYDGQSIAGWPPDRRKTAGLAYLPQHNSTFPHLTVEENLKLGGWLLRKDRARLQERLEYVYALFLLLAERRRMKATNLSGGQLRMLAVGKEIVTPPRLLVDEPSVGMSPKVAAEVYDLLVQVPSWGITVLLAPMFRYGEAQRFEYATLITIALSVVLQNLAIIVAGPYQLSPKEYLPTIPLGDLGISLNGSRLAGALGAAVILAGFWFFVKKTMLGLSFLGTAQNRVGAQTCGIKLQQVDMIGFATGVALAAAAGALLGYGLGWLTLGMRGIYFAISTWAFAESVRILLAINYQLTRGDMGLIVPFLFDTPDPFPYYYVFLAATVAALLLNAAMLRMKIGYRMRAIRDDQELALAAGVDVVKWKRIVFMISTGLAGVLYGHSIGLLSPSQAHFTQMAFVIIAVVLGGFRTLWGPVIGGLLAQGLAEALRVNAEWRFVIFGLLVLIIIRLYPPGIMGFVNSVIERFRRPSGPRPSTRPAAEAGG